MSDHFETLRRSYVQRTPHMVEIGCRITDLAPARGTMCLPARADWLGDRERMLMHPGAITVLADSCCGLAVGTSLDADNTYATLDLRMDYLRPATPERDVICEAHCYRLTRSVAFVRAEAHQGDPDQPVAAAQASFMLSTPSGARPSVAPGTAAPEASEAFASATAEALATMRTTAAAERAASGWAPPADSEPVMPAGSIPYLDFLGIRIARDPQRPVFRLPFDPKLVGNPFLPALHGGVIAGFAETAAIVHLMQTLAGAKLPKGIDFSLDYLRAGRPEESFAACEVVRVGARVALVQVRVWQRSPDTPIAVARAHFLLTPKA